MLGMRIEPWPDSVASANICGKYRKYSRYARKRKTRGASGRHAASRQAVNAAPAAASCAGDRIGGVKMP